MRRDEILAAALKVFARRGLAATRISDIASEAGISQGLLYHYFAGKEEMFTAIVERSLKGTLWVTNAAKEQPGTPWDQLSWMFTFMAQGGRRSPDYLLVAIQATTSDSVPPDTRELMERYGKTIFQNVVELVSQAQAAGQVIPGNPGKLAFALLSCVQGLAIASVTGSSDPDLIPEPDLMLRAIKA